MINQSLIAGILLVIIPFTGFPSAWKVFAYVVIGLVLIGWALMKKNQFFGFFASKNPAAEEKIVPPVSPVTPENQ